MKLPDSKLDRRVLMRQRNETMQRRTFLKTAGVSAGALLVGSTSGSATDSERFIVDRRGFQTTGGITVIHELDPVDLLVVEATENQLKDSRADYAPDPRISPDSFAPVRRARLAETDDDGSEDLFRYQWDKQDQRIPEAHEMTRGENTRIAIVDSGIASGHPDLEGQVNLNLSKNFTGDDFGVGEPYAGAHGTHVAGIAAASDETDDGVIGSAPGAELVDLRVFTADPDGDISADTGAELPPDFWTETFMGDVMAALVYATDIGCDVANFSLGWTWLMRWDGWNTFWGKVMQRVGNYAQSNGTLHTHACGNWGGSLQFNQDVTDSSEIAGGLTISATGPVGFNPETGEWEQPPYTPATYTNHGIGAVDLGAPGGRGGEHTEDNVLNTIAFPSFDENGDYVGAEYGYAWFAGTSMAAPQVAGAIALLKSANPRYTANQVRSTLKRAADHPDEYERKYYGSGGYLDTYAALEASHNG